MYVLTDVADIVPTTDDELQDEIIVDRIRAGEGRLFALLYRRYRARTFALAHGMTGRRDQAEDLTQEIFLRVYCRLDTFQGQAKFATWFYRIALNQCLNYCRYERKYVPTFGPADVRANVELTEHADTTLLRKEILEHIRSALLSLKPELRLLLLLKEIDGLSYDEIAERLEISTGTVASRLNRGRRLLARKLENLKGKI
jgi:RNA polymerase sigma-70 factor (ECF subfamily)